MFKVYYGIFTNNDLDILGPALFTLHQICQDYALLEVSTMFQQPPRRTLNWVHVQPQTYGFKHV